MKLVFIAFVIAAPIAWYLMQNWLEGYVYRIQIGWRVFVVTGACALLIVLFTISYQSMRAALMKPIKNLRAQ